MRALLLSLVVCVNVAACGGEDPPRDFACGDETCSLALHYCRIDQGSAVTTYTCADQIGLCREDPSCECVANELPMDCTCVEDPADVLTATCPQ